MNIFGKNVKNFVDFWKKCQKIRSNFERILENFQRFVRNCKNFQNFLTIFEHLLEKCRDF